MENPIGTNFRYPSGMGWGGSGLVDSDEVFAEIDLALGAILIDILTLYGRVGAKVATIEALKALTTDRVDEKLYPCDDIGTGVSGLYQYDAGSTTSESLPDVVDPADHVGRFFLKPNANMTMPKVASGHPDEILAATAGGSAALTGVLKTQVPSVDEKGALVGTSGTAPSAVNPLVDVADTRLFYKPVLGRFDNTAALPATPVSGDRYIAHVTANGWTAERIYQCKTNGSWDDQIEQIPIAGRAVYNLQTGDGCVAIVEGVKVFTVAGAWGSAAWDVSEAEILADAAVAVTPGGGNTGVGTVACASGVRSGLFEIKIMSTGAVGVATFKWRRAGGTWQDNESAGYTTAADVELTSYYEEHERTVPSGQHVQMTAGGEGDDFVVGDTFSFTPVLSATANHASVEVTVPLVTPEGEYDDFSIVSSAFVSGLKIINDSVMQPAPSGGFTEASIPFVTRKTVATGSITFRVLNMGATLNGKAVLTFAGLVEAGV